MRQYIDIDSTYRDRLESPYPAQFNIKFNHSDSNTAITNNAPEFPLTSVSPLTFFEDYPYGPPYTTAVTQEQTNLPYMFSVPSSGNDKLIFIDSLPLSSTDPTSTSVDAVTTSSLISPPAVNNYFIDDYIQNFDTGETRKIVDYIYNSTPLILHGGLIESYNIDTNLNAIFGLSQTSIIYPIPSNINRFYVGKIFRHVSSDTSFNIIDSYQDPFGNIYVVVFGQLSVTAEPNDVFEIIASEQWYVVLDSPWTTALPSYPGYREIPYQWNVQNSVSGRSWFSVCWSEELGINVAVGTNGGVMKSVDGKNWVGITVPTSNDLRCVIWNPDLLQFVAVGESPSLDGVLVSDDGDTWTVQSTPAGTTNYVWVSVVWTGTIYCAVCSSDNGATTNQAMTSADGTTWVSQDILAGANNYSSITWSPSLGLLCAVINDIATSTNAVTSPTGLTGSWTARALADQEWTSVTWSSLLSLFCAVSTIYVTGGAYTRVATSPTGVVWTLRTVPGNNVELTNVFWYEKLQGAFYAVGWNTLYVYRSFDGINWDVQTGIWAKWNSISYNGNSDSLVAVGSETVSADQRVMTTQTLPYPSVNYYSSNVDQLSSTSSSSISYITHTDGTQGVVSGEVAPFTSLLSYSVGFTGSWSPAVPILATPTSINSIESFVINGLPSVCYEIGGVANFVQATSANGSTWGTPGTTFAITEFLPFSLRESFTSTVSTPYTTPKKPMIIGTNTGSISAPGDIVAAVNANSDGSGAWSTTAINAHQGIVGSTCTFQLSVYKYAVLLTQGNTEVSSSVYVNIGNSLGTVWGSTTTGGVLDATTQEILISNDINVKFTANRPSIVGTLSSEGICALFVAYQEYTTGNIYVTVCQENLPKSRTLVATDASISTSTINLFVDSASSTVYLYYMSDNALNVLVNKDYAGWSLIPIQIALYSQIRTVKLSTKVITASSVDIPTTFTIGYGGGIHIPNIVFMYGTELLNLSAEVLNLTEASHYRIRKESALLDQSIGDIVTGSYNTIELPSTASSVDNYYANRYIWIYNRNVGDVPFPYWTFNDIALIKSYDGATRTATVYPAFSADIATYSNTILNWEIWTIEDSQYNPLTTVGYTIQNRDEQCYEVELVSISLPNLILTTGIGNRIAFYPYVYVKFRSISEPLQNIIFSNNPNATNVLFKVPITNVNTPDRATFVVMAGGGMVQTIKFRFSDVFQFAVYLPNGELFIVEESDTIPPIPANFNVQISATFRFTRLDRLDRPDRPVETKKMSSYYSR
jgi:hypothetical protein